MATFSNSVADVVFPIARDLLAVQVAKTNPESAKRTTRYNTGTMKPFNPVFYADTILKLFFGGLDQNADVAEIGQVIGRFAFSDALKVTYPDGYPAYTKLVKIIPEGGYFGDTDYEDDDEAVDMGADGGYGRKYILPRHQGYDSGFHSPSGNRKPSPMIQFPSGATMNLDSTHACYPNSPIISIDTKKLILFVQGMLARGFCNDRAKLMVLWQQIICVRRPAVNGRSIVEQTLLGGQLDIKEDADCINLEPLVEFRKRVSENPSILLSGIQLPETEGWLISYEWLTIAQSVLEALEQAREKKLVELRVARDSK